MEPFTLITNGLSIVGAGLSAGSLIKGFSLEKRVNQIDETLNRLEQLNYLLKTEVDKQLAVQEQIKLQLKRLNEATVLTDNYIKHDITGLLKNLINDPYGSGVTAYSEITDSGIVGLNEGNIITNNITPITWNNPVTNKIYIGEIPMGVLERHGINIEVPDYQFTVNGHAYNRKSGLYVPIRLIYE